MAAPKSPSVYPPVQPTWAPTAAASTPVGPTNQGGYYFIN